MYFPGSHNAWAETMFFLSRFNIWKIDQIYLLVCLSYNLHEPIFYFLKW